MLAATFGTVGASARPNAATLQWSPPFRTVSNKTFVTGDGNNEVALATVAIHVRRSVNAIGGQYFWDVGAEATVDTKGYLDTHAQSTLSVEALDCTVTTTQAEPAISGGRQAAWPTDHQSFSKVSLPVDVSLTGKSGGVTGKVSTTLNFFTHYEPTPTQTSVVSLDNPPRAHEWRFNTNGAPVPGHTWGTESMWLSTSNRFGAVFQCFPTIKSNVAAAPDHHYTGDVSTSILLKNPKVTKPAPQASPTAKPGANPVSKTRTKPTTKTKTKPVAKSPKKPVARPKTPTASGGASAYYKLDSISWCIAFDYTADDFVPTDRFSGFVGDRNLANAAYDTGLGAFSSTLFPPSTQHGSSFYGFLSAAKASAALASARPEFASGTLVSRRGNIVMLGIPSELPSVEQRVLDGCFAKAKVNG